MISVFTMLQLNSKSKAKVSVCWVVPIYSWGEIFIRICCVEQKMLGVAGFTEAANVAMSGKLTR